MSGGRGGGAAAAAAGRGGGRPLSGVWSVLGWLRGEHRASSDDSLSSGTSARTAHSFAYLQPASYPAARAERTAPPPASPPSDTYRKRVSAGELRREYERHLTLHRKYLLPLGEVQYGALTLPSPPARRGDVTRDRERRAASESLPRRLAHVPGKRRAPPPPPPSPRAATASRRRRRRSAKRPAPLPPTFEPSTSIIRSSELLISNKENSDTQMNSKPISHGRGPESTERSECKSEMSNGKVSLKPRQEKSFLKQIFENRKRNSAIDVPPVKLLPSISELDKQAAELLKSYKLKAFEHNNNVSSAGASSGECKLNGSTESSDMWFCTRCLRKYDATMVTCLDCLSQAKVYSDSSAFKDSCLALKKSENQRPSSWSAPSLSNDLSEKKKLKEMLKEMKDSLPKRHKPDRNGVTKNEYTFNKPQSSDDKVNHNKETPTLPIGSTIPKEVKFESQPSSSKQNCVKITDFVIKDKTSPKLEITRRPTETVIITQTTVLVDSTPRAASVTETLSLHNNVNSVAKKTEPIKNEVKSETFGDKQKDKVTDKVNGIHQPMKISSLFNPIYIPASNVIKHNTVGDKNVVTKDSDTKLQIDKPSSLQIQVNTQAAKIKTEEFQSLVISTSQTSKQDLPVTNKTETTTTEVNSKLNSIQTKDTLVNSAEKEQISEEKMKETNNKQVITSQNPAHVNTDVTKKSFIAAPTESTNSRANVTSQTHAGTTNSNKKCLSSEQLSKRRDLVNQLEKSIAKGDERAAAEAAISLAQLKLACSVLTFSSQIMGEVPPSTSSNKIPIDEEKHSEQDATKNYDTAAKSLAKVNSATQSEGTRCSKVNLVSTKSADVNKPTAESGRASHVNASVSSTTNDIDNSKTIPTRSVSSPEASTSRHNVDRTEDSVMISVWVEDRAAARGPVRVPVCRSATLLQLRRAAEASLGVPARLQRWIVGRALCGDDDAPLVALAGPALDAPFYLCLVESEPKKDTSTEPKVVDKSKPSSDEEKATAEDRTGRVYSELVQLERCALVPNTETFECAVCLERCGPGEGVVLRDCVHAFCRECLAAGVRHSEEASVACPAPGCTGSLQERELRALVPSDQYERWLARTLATAESGAAHAFHCRTRDCAGWALCDPGVQHFPCPVCRRTSCVPCQAIHEGETCEEHRTRLREGAGGVGSQRADEGTRALLDAMIARGEALECPKCSAVISKKWGCDWVRCSACKTEICWVTRGLRWGPLGKGDTSAGCRCGVDGKRCHPSCGYCH